MTRALVRRVKERVGEVVVTVECVDDFPRSVNVEFRAVIAMLPPDVIARARAGQ